MQQLLLKSQKTFLEMLLAVASQTLFYVTHDDCYTKNVVTTAWKVGTTLHTRFLSIVRGFLETDCLHSNILPPVY